MKGATLAALGIAMVIAWVAAPGAASADTPTLNPSGMLTFSWHGDPARGCQAAGVCAVSGSLQVIPQDQSGSSETPPSRNINIEDDGSVVRVTDPGSTPSQPHVCTQLVPVDMMLTVVHLRHERLQALVSPFSTPSSGDCAGPLPLDLGGFTLPTRRLPGRTEAYDLSSSQRFGAGPYEVTLRSTIRARRPGRSANADGVGGSSSVSSSSGVSAGSGPKPKKELVEHVSAVYRMSAVSGKITTTFAGRPDPLCAPFDACGATGTLADSISGASSTLEFDAQKTVARRVSRHAAVADLQSGRLPLLESAALLTDVLSATVGWSAGSACTDRLRHVNALDIDSSGVNRHHQVLFTLATDEVEDPFRTYCPGPAATDVLGPANTLARALTPVRELGRHRLLVVLNGRGEFAAGSYTGARSARVTFALRLVRLRAGTTIENVFGRLP